MLLLFRVFFLPRVFPFLLCLRVLGFQVLSKGAQAAVFGSLVAGHCRGCRELQDLSVYRFFF
jgi:hypothetical protein